MVTSSAHFIFDHAHVGLKKFGRGRAAAAVNYQMNENKCEKLLTVNLPSHNRHALEDHVQRYEDRLPRKDSRVLETFIIGFPIGMSAEHRVLAARRFLWALTGHGRSQGWAALHHNDPGNPHFHANLMDRDITTGEPVLHMSKPPKERRSRGLDATGTETGRRLWETACNSVFEEFGYDLRVNRLSYEKQRALADKLANENAIAVGPVEGSPEVHTEGRPEEVADDIHVAHHDDPPPHAPTDQLEEPAPEAQAEALVEPEPEMTREEQLDAIRQELDEQDRKQEQPEQPGRIVAGNKPVSVAGKVKGSIELWKRGKEVRAARSRLQTALDWNRSAEEAAATATVAYNQLQDDTERFNDYHRGAFGRGLAGINLFGFKLFGRKEAEAAQRRVQVGQRTYKALYDAHAEKARIAEREEAVTRADQQRIEGYASMTPEERREALKGMAQAAEIIDQTQADTLQGVTGEQVYEAFKRGELTADEAQEACHWLGDRIHAARIAQEAELGEEQEL